MNNFSKQKKLPAVGGRKSRNRLVELVVIAAILLSLGLIFRLEFVGHTSSGGGEQAIRLGNAATNAQSTDVHRLRTKNVKGIPVVHAEEEAQEAKSRREAMRQHKAASIQISKPSTQVQLQVQTQPQPQPQSRSSAAVQLQPVRLDCPAVMRELDELVKKGEATFANVDSHRTKKRFQIAVYNRNDFVSAEVRSLRSWEPLELNDLLEQMAKKPSTLVDIGANVGWFTMQALAEGHRAIVFEPMHENMFLIKASACLNGPLGFIDRLTLYQNGVGSEVEVCKVISDPINKGDGHTVCSSAYGGDRSKVEAYIQKQQYIVRNTIEVVALDQTNFADTLPSGQVVVKMDIEGHEMAAVNGMRNWLRNPQKRPAFVSSEVWKELHGGFKRSDVVHAFQELGYSVRSSGDGKPTFPTDLEQLRKELDTDKGAGQIYCVPTSA